MIAYANILTFLYSLFFLFFFFIHFSGSLPKLTVLELCRLRCFTYFLFSIFFYLGEMEGGNSSSLSSILSSFVIQKIDKVKLIIRDFPSNFSCSIFFFLLVSCFYFLRPLQIVLVTSSCGACRREIRRFGGGG